MNGSSTAASSAMMASTHTISSKVKPRSPCSLIIGGRSFERDVGCRTATAFLAVGAVGHDVIRSVFARRAVHIAMVPRIVGNVAALQIGPIPGGDARRSLDERRKALGCGGKPAG